MFTAIKDWFLWFARIGWKRTHVHYFTGGCHYTWTNTKTGKNRFTTEYYNRFP